MGTKLGSGAQTALFASIFFVSSLASASLLFRSAYISTDLLSLTSINALAHHFLTLKFIGLALALPFTFAFASALSHTRSRVELYKAVLPGSFIGTAAAIILSGVTVTSIILAFFFLAGVVVSVEVSFLRKAELKSFVTFRTASEACKKAFLVLAFGIFLASASISLSDNDANVKELGDTILNLSFNPQAGSSTDLASVSADITIGAEKQTLASITGTNEFQKLSSKQDPDVQAFVAEMNAAQATAGDPATREKLVEKLRRKQAGAAQSLNFDFLRSQSPFIDGIATYYWLIAAFALTSGFLFAANIILANLAGIYAALARRVTAFFAE